jgi:hypothetical protein
MINPEEQFITLAEAQELTGQSLKIIRNTVTKAMTKDNGWDNGSLSVKVTTRGSGKKNITYQVDRDWIIKQFGLKVKIQKENVEKLGDKLEENNIKFLQEVIRNQQTTIERQNQQLTELTRVVENDQKLRLIDTQKNIKKSLWSKITGYLTYKENKDIIVFPKN